MLRGPVDNARTNSASLANVWLGSTSSRSVPSGPLTLIIIVGDVWCCDVMALEAGCRWYRARNTRVNENEEEVDYDFKVCEVSML